MIIDASTMSRPALDLGSLLAPRSIAIIGASADEGRHNGRPIANLLRTGYTGRIYPITPREGDIRGLPSYRSIADVPEAVDLAYVLVRADKVAGVVEQCVASGVRNLVVNASGFAEEGADGEREQQRIRELAWSRGTRVIGPNCIGILSVTDNSISVTTLNITTSYTPGDVTIVSQSGGMATNIFNRMQGERIGVRAVLSLGNEADVDVADVVEALAADDETRTILLYVEQLRDVARFRRAVESARAAGKAIYCAKAGRSGAGMRSAQSHTGAMAGEFDVFRDLVQAMGVSVVETLDDLVDAAKIRQRIGAIPGRRVLVLSPSGGECGYLSDLAEEAGLDMPQLSPELAQRLQEVMRFGAPANPLDLTGQIIGDNELMAQVFDAISHSAEFDAVVVGLPTWGPFDSRRLMPAIVEAAHRSEVPMIITAWAARDLTEWRDDLLRGEKLVAFDSAERAVRALAAAAATSVTATPSREPMSGRDVPWDPAVVRDEAAAKAWLASIGVAVSEEQTFALGAELNPSFGFPVVVKGLAPGLAHKSELGLVNADVRNADDLQHAVSAIQGAARTHGVALDGILVARRYSGVELITGVVDDLSFGKVLMIGAGGVLAELLDDKTFVACPASEADVRAALGRLRISRLLDGFRGETSDVDALVALLVRVSEIAAGCAELSELDLNPIIVGAVGEGAVVVDALVRAGA